MLPVAPSAVSPSRAIEGGRISIDAAPLRRPGFAGFDLSGPHLPEVRIGGARARVVYASAARLDALVPPGVEAGRVTVYLDALPGEALHLDIAATFATGLHQVDNPVFDPAGNLYVTFSGTRGQQVPVSIFRVRPDGTRETFCTGLVNPTSMVFGPDGDLYVSSRFEGTVSRVKEDGSVEPFASDLGVACGLAFDREGTLFVGDRSGTIFRVDRSGRATAFATVPSSVAAFHLAMAPDQTLYVTGPTLSAYDAVYRVDREGRVTPWYERFGRPQGLAFDTHGTLHVVEALAGSSGVYRLTPGGEAASQEAPSGDAAGQAGTDQRAVAELALAGPGLVGIAFDPGGGLVVCSNETAYRLPPVQRPETRDEGPG